MQPVNSVCIVGAGSSGWLTALSLRIFCPFATIRLIRPRDHKAIGVGESTQGDFYTLLQGAGFDLADFYRACDATMKCGIFYRDWNVIGDHYWHPFGKLTAMGRYTPAHHFQQLIVRAPDRFRHDQYYASVHRSYDACVRKKLVAPESAIALHVDAKLITEYFEKHLPDVEVLEADSIDVKVREGQVAAIVLDGVETTADLYVDCTGFTRALHSRIAEPDFLPYEANVDRAVAAQVPYLDVEKEIRPYTRAHAHEHGWTWTIPLRTRIGSGYVYHSDFCSPDEAESNFRAYWGEDRMRDVAVAHIPFDSATIANPWAANVVAIGLSAGFVEPLEATGLNWVNTAAYLLCHSINGQFFEESTAARYNAVMQGYIQDVQDFIDVHYKLSSRRDSDFWKYQTSRQYPERLDHALGVYRESMPTKANRTRSFMKAFSDVSWIDILNGYRFEYAEVDVDPQEAALAQQRLQEIAANPEQGVKPLAFVPG
jgi:2-polyprenyl-6-methoxyphenol hydroxylase-like FAD-dependent oxidoreductase